MPAQTIALITSAAAHFGATVDMVNDHQVRLQVPIQHRDGYVERYALLASANGSRVTVKEEVATHLPPFCPERHINADGSFCLAWQESDRLEILDEETAITWWATLWKFLSEQRRAARLRRWPTSLGRAHGDAARYQALAQSAAEALGLVRAGKTVDTAGLRIQRCRGNHSRREDTLRLYRGDEYLYSVWLQQEKLTNQKRPCRCSSTGQSRPRRFRRCGDHAAQAVVLAMSLHKWQVAEAEFWEALQGRTCCGTCDGCPLSENNASQLVAATPLEQ